MSRFRIRPWRAGLGTRRGQLVPQKQTFPEPATLSLQPDHSVNRMLSSQGVSMDALKIGQLMVENPLEVWVTFASHSYLFRGPPTRIWLDNAIYELFGSRNGCRTKTPIIILTPSPKSCIRRSSFPFARFDCRPAGELLLRGEGADCAQVAARSGRRSLTLRLCRARCQVGRAKRRRWQKLERLSECVGLGAGPFPRAPRNNRSLSSGADKAWSASW